MSGSRLSGRIQQLQPSATLAVTAKAAALREQGVDVIGFAAGQPDFDTPAHIKTAAAAALDAGDTKYPTPVAGKNPLRDAIVAYFKEYCGLDYTRDQVCVSVGGKDSLYLLFQTVLDPGDEVVILAPYWVSYPDQVRLAGGNAVIITPADKDTLKATAAEIDAAITPKTKLLILNSPSNPTGVMYSRGELEAIAEVVRRRDILVASDEIYHRLLFVDEPCVSFATLDGMYERTITVNGFSKTYAMTGWRLGFVGGPLEIVKGMARLQGQATSGPTSFAQTGAIAALTGDQSCVSEMVVAYRRRLDLMHGGLSGLPGVSCVRPDGAFYCFPDVSASYAKLGVADANEFATKALDEVNVALVSGAPFGFPTHVRLSFATSDAQIVEGLRRLASFLA